MSPHGEAISIRRQVSGYLRPVEGEYEFRETSGCNPFLFGPAAASSVTQARFPRKAREMNKKSVEPRVRD
jgi:hypothetical protein